jgi:3-phenylpropionate/trans-cinnamate dioxygenase ferredoxin subunit/naphthalene 1,2-dioxygenase system ferredoxin subunit
MAREKSWQNLIPIADLEKNWVTLAILDKLNLAIYDTPGGLYASLASCSHGGANLCDGYFDGYIIECPLHQGAFDVRTGKVVSAPATRSMKMIEVREQEGFVQVFI